MPDEPVACAKNEAIQLHEVRGRGLLSDIVRQSIPDLCLVS